MSAAFSPSFMVMQRPLGSTTAFSIDSLIGGPPQPSPGHFVYTGYPMFMPYRSVVLQPPPPPPPALQQALPAGHPAHPQIPGLQGGFCSGLAQGLTGGMALTSTLMASLPGGFSPSQQHQDAARKFGSQALHAELRLEAEDGKSSAVLQAFHDTDTPVHASTGWLLRMVLLSLDPRLRCAALPKLTHKDTLELLCQFTFTCSSFLTFPK